MVALSASRLVCPATAWISLITSPIFCAAFASEPIWSLVAPASVEAMPTRLLVCPSWRLISSIEADSSFAADAAISTLAEASFDIWTAPSARCEALCEDANKVVAVERMATALSLTVLSIASTRWRNAAMAASTVVRRRSCVARLSRSWS